MRGNIKKIILESQPKKGRKNMEKKIKKIKRLEGSKAHLQQTEERREQICFILNLTRAEADELLPLLKKELSYV